MKFTLIFAILSVLGACTADDVSAVVPREINRYLDAYGRNENAVIRDRSRNPRVRVTTKMGPVDGVLMETCRKSRKFAAFFGMPYGRPPIGSLRFKAPLPAEPWDGVYDATFERPSCMQFEGNVNTESEDCLYINVYTPEPRNKPRPVMVFIYGGAFIGGSSNFTLYGPDLFIENDVILVTFNYRLGVLGFLSLQTPEYPGNAGLKDQKLALEWVRDNIKSFGGDPNSVTIFGESAGAASVSYHLLSSASKGLFHRAILESGSAFSPWAFIQGEQSVKIAANLAKKLGCPQSGQKMIDCLTRMSAYKITKEQEKGLTLDDILAMRPISFVPTKEPNVPGAFLTENPIDALTSGKITEVPVIFGLNSREGLLLLPALKSLDPLNIAVNLMSFNLNTFFPTQVKSSLTDKEKNYLNKVLRQFYANVKPVGTFNTLKMIDIISDVAFLVPVEFMTSVFSKGSQPVYSYVFTFDGEYGYYKKNLNLTVAGVCHGDELGYLFYNGGCNLPSNETKIVDAERVTEIITTLWTNFAKTGNPTPDDRLPKWPAYKPGSVMYADIGKELKTGSELPYGLESRLQFWVKLINEINKT